MIYHIATWARKARSLVWSGFATGALALFARPAFAEDITFDPFGFKDATGLGDTEPVVIAGNIINVILTFLGIVLVLLILWAGFNWMTAAGNEEKVKNARQTLQRAIIGLLIVLAAYGISAYVFDVLLTATGAA